MEQAYLDRHINLFLQKLAESAKPLDLCLSHYFKAHKNLGAKDRREIGGTVYGLERWKSLLDYFAPKDRLAFYRSLPWESVLKDASVPIYARLGLTPFLYERFRSAFGEEKTKELSQILQSQAPMTVRANLLKISQKDLFQLWKDRYSIALCDHAPAGIQFDKREPLFSLPEFKEGLFEVQDEGSQLIANLVQAKPGDCVLDYCSGSGGKTLAFAPAMQGKGQIYLHDIRIPSLYEARKRLKRAGIQNGQTLPPGHKQLSRLKNKCDWVLIDVPCSGTGTLRRNPDQKWKIDAPLVDRLVKEQKLIAKQALEYVKPGGFLVYATCSLLPEENEDQIKFLLSENPLKLEREPLFLLPKAKGMDGFFGALLKKTSN